MNIKGMSMYSTQYLVGAPFAWITAAMWRGMASISLWHCSGVMRSQVALIVAFSSSALLGLAYRIFLFTIPHRYKKVFSQPPIVQVLPLCKLWWKISIWSITKFHLNTLLYTLCWQWQKSNVFCKSSQGFHTLLLVFWPIPPCRSPLEQWCFGAVAGQHGLSTPSKDFLWGWDLETGSATPEPWNASYEATPSLPGRCVWDHCHAERPSHVSSSMPLLMEGGFHSKSHDTWPHSFFPLHRSVVLVPLQKNSPKAWCFHPHASQ